MMSVIDADLSAFTSFLTVRLVQVFFLPVSFSAALKKNNAFMVFEWTGVQTGRLIPNKVIQFILK